MDARLPDACSPSSFRRREDLVRAEPVARRVFNLVPNKVSCPHDT